MVCTARVKSAIGVSVLLVLAAACGSQDGSSSASGAASEGPATELKIGSVQSLTGSFSALGQASQGGLKVAVAEINAKGFTVAGKRYVVKLVTADAASDPAKATLAATQLIRDENVKFIMGPAESGEAVPVQVQTSKAGVLWFTSSFFIHDALKDKVNDPLYKYTFAVGTGADDAIKASVEAVLKLRPNAKTAVALYPNRASDDHSVQSAISTFAAHNVTAKAERFDVNIKDFTPILTRVKVDHPDVLLVGSATSFITLVAKQMAELGDVAGLLAASGAGASTALSDAIGKPLPFPYSYYSPGGVDPYVTEPGVKSFYDAYNKVNGGPPPPGNEGLSSFFYAPLKHLVNAMQDAGTVDDVDKISASLLRVRGTAAVADFSYNQFRQARVPTAVCLVVDGKVNCVEVPFSDS
jgi:branched-chain amino acid transport system substrate-binding protein